MDVNGFFATVTAIIQVFRKVAFVDKPAYTPTYRKAFWEWPEGIETKTGIFANGVLSVAEKTISSGAPQVVLIESLLETHRVFDTQSPSTKQQFDIFRLEHVEDSAIALHTHFTGSRFTEVPQAANHQIALLKSGDSVRYMANDRIDFNSTSRRQRTYVLYDYLVSYLGEASIIESIDASALVGQRPIELNKYKWVDERKVLK